MMRYSHIAMGGAAGGDVDDGGFDGGDVEVPGRQM